jgi:hypothetical protein
MLKIINPLKERPSCCAWCVGIASISRCKSALSRATSLSETLKLLWRAPRRPRQPLPRAASGQSPLAL